MTEMVLNGDFNLDNTFEVSKSISPPIQSWSYPEPKKGQTYIGSLGSKTFASTISARGNPSVDPTADGLSSPHHFAVLQLNSGENNGIYQDIHFPGTGRGTLSFWICKRASYKHNYPTNTGQSIRVVLAANVGTAIVDISHNQTDAVWNKKSVDFQILNEHKNSRLSVMSSSPNLTADQSVFITKISIQFTPDPEPIPPTVPPPVQPPISTPSPSSSFINESLLTSNQLIQSQLDTAEENNQNLRKQILGEKAKQYFLINEQNLSLEDAIRKIENESTTDNKKNYYQLEQNKNIHYIYKLMFWFYYLFVLIYILVLFIMTDYFVVTKVLLSFLFVIFPFLILPLEYLVVFVVYYVRSFIMATPFTTSSLPISMPTHSFEYVPTNVLDFKNF